MEFFKIDLSDAFSSGEYINDPDIWDEDGTKIGVCVSSGGQIGNFYAAGGTCNGASLMQKTNLKTNLKSTVGNRAILNSKTSTRFLKH